MVSSFDPSNSRSVAIVHYSAPPVIGGVESTIYHHARLLADCGFTVQVIAGRGEKFHPAVSLHTVPEMNSRHPVVLDVGKSLAGGIVDGRFYELRNHLVERLRPLLAGAGVCIIHNATTLHKNVPLTAALRDLCDEMPTSFISWAHDFAWLEPLYLPELHTGYPWELLRTPWPGVHHVAVSEHGRELMSGLFNIPGDEIRVISPGVDMPHFLKLEPLTLSLVEKLDLMGADPIMLLPSRITRRKNIEFAVSVTAALVEKRPSSTLVVTGPTGPHNPANSKYLGELKELRKRLGITPRVHFLCECGEDGSELNLPDAALSDFFNLADLLIFPSLREGFGIPILEAGLSRLPAFAADIPSVRESGAQLVHLFDPLGDPAGVSEAIDEYLASSSLYQLRRRVIDRFTWQAVLKKAVIPLIEEVSRHEYPQKS